jgi:putative component of membrane protein insertase Oxa1/YidC/SpoIIIJ protein YidD
MKTQYRSLLADRLALAAIDFYRRWLSPRKGFSCACRVHAGQPSCSAFGYRAVRRHGLFTGLGLIRERTARCGDIHRSHHPRLPASQRGVCDCGGCDLPLGLDCSPSPCDFVSCCDGCGHSSKKQRDESPRRKKPGDRAPS